MKVTEPRKCKCCQKEFIPEGARKHGRVMFCEDCACVSFSFQGRVNNHIRRQRMTRLEAEAEARAFYITKLSQTEMRHCAWCERTFRVPKDDDRIFCSTCLSDGSNYLYQRCIENGLPLPNRKRIYKGPPVDEEVGHGFRGQIAIGGSADFECKVG